jgi:hypothetical protein
VTGTRAAGQAETFTVTVGRHTLRPSSVTHTPEPPLGEGDGAGAGAVGAGEGVGDGAGAGVGDGPPPGVGAGRGLADGLACPGAGEPADATSRVRAR